MILHPGILALLLGSIISLLALIYSAWTGITILRHWDLSSSSAQQLTLERRTYLVSTLAAFALVVNTFSVFLFIFTVEDIHPLFVGAMCATGSLNANPVGWYSLLTKIILFFAAAYWLSLNYLDQSSERYPLVKVKYLLLLALLPILALDLYLMASYFLGLDPAIITSCCGSMFSEGDETTLASLTAVPVLPAMSFFVLSALVLVCILILALQRPSRPLSIAGSLFAALFFVAAIFSIISFVAPYAYELPTHHCPFDLLQRQYRFVGYPLYFFLFAGVYYTTLPGLFSSLRNSSDLDHILVARERVWISRGLFCLILFLGLVAWIIMASNLAML